MTVSHQLVLMLQSVLEQGPYDGLQLRVGGQQVRTEYLQPHVGQPVHCGERILSEVIQRDLMFCLPSGEYYSIKSNVHRL